MYARFILLCAVFAAQTAGDAMFRGGPDHLGVYGGASPALSSVAWKFATAGRVLSSPLVVSGTVYVGSADRNLYAIDAATGTLRWKFATKGAVNSSPAYSAGLVFATSEDGTFYAVDATSGAQRWSFATGGESRFVAPGIHGIAPRTEMMPDPFDVFLSSPAVAGGTVYFGSGDHNVYALDAATGTLKWKFRTGNVVHASPAVANGVVYIGSWDRNMYALDAASGRERWRYQTGNDTVIYNQVGIPSSAAVAGGTVYFGCRDGHLYAVDAASGKLKWADDNHGSWVVASPAAAGGVVYYATSDGKRFKGLDAATGAVKVDVATKYASFSSAAIVGHTAYFGTQEGRLHALDVATGNTIAEFETDGWKENHARYVDDKGMFIGSALADDFGYEGVIVAMHRIMTLGTIHSSPAVANGVLYVGSTDGKVYALR